MKIIYFIICFLSFSLFSQNLKINQAEYYFKAYRFAESTPIYKELIAKDHIKVLGNESVYRNAITSAEKSRDFIFAYDAISQLSTSESFTNDDNYHFFQLSLLTKNYSKAKELIFKGIIIEKNGNKLDLAKIYFDGKIWEDIAKDTSEYKITEVDFNSGLGDFGAIYHPKGIVFSSSRDLSAKEWSFDNSSFLNLYLKEKSNNKLSLINVLKSKRHDGTSYYDSINKIWYFARNFDAKNNNELTTTGLFFYDEKTQVETPFAYNNDSSFIAQPFLSDNGQTLWFSSNRTGSIGGSDIWYCKKTESGWSTPVNAGTIINTIENEMFPFFQKGKLYFSSNGHAGLGGLDIFSVNYDNGSVSNIKNLGAGLNSNADDFSLVLENIGKTGFMSSNRIDYVDHIYSVQVKFAEFVFKGKLLAEQKDSLDMKLFPIVIKENGKTIDTLYADKDGDFEFKTEKNDNYTFEINNEKYLPITESYSTLGKTVSDTTFKTFTLKPKMVTLNAIVLDEKTDKPLPFAKVHIQNNITKEEKVYTADKDGKFTAELERDQVFDAHATHSGYFDKKSEIKTINTSDVIDKEIELKFIFKGSSFAIENIFYDFGKATLRPESKVELDKLAIFLKNNPKLKVELSAHTDSRGGDARNLVLSQQRAQSCVDYLITVGVNKSNIVAKGYGETKLINRCKNDVNCTEDEHQKNRRTEIKVL